MKPYVFVTRNYGQSFESVAGNLPAYGNVQVVREVYLDCDADTILLKVHQIGGAACHEGYPSCFFRRLESDGLQVVSARVFDPNQVYKK